MKPEPVLAASAERMGAASRAVGTPELSPIHNAPHFLQ